MADTWMRLIPETARTSDAKLGCSTKQRASGQSRSKSPMICAWSAFQMRSRGVCWGLANHVFWVGVKRLLERGMRLCGFVTVVFALRLLPNKRFQGPLHSAGHPLSSLMSPQIGPSLSFFLLPFHPPTSPHHTQSRASSCSVQAVIATPQTSNCALNALNQAAVQPGE